MSTQDARVLARNSITGIANYGVAALLAFLITPVVLIRLGDERYGVWSLLFVVLSTAHLSDLGLSTTLVKLVSERLADPDSNELSRVVISIVTVNLLIATALAFLIFLGRDVVLVGLLGISDPYLAESRTALTILCAALPVAFLGRSLGAILEGSQHVYKVNLLRSVTHIIGSFSTLVVVSLGLGLPGMLAVQFAVALLPCPILLHSIRRVHPQLHWNLRYFQAAIVKRGLRYGLAIAGGNLMSVLADPLSKVMTSHFLSLQWVAYLDIGIRLANLMRSPAFALLSGLLAAVSRLYSGRDVLQIRRLYTRYLSLIFLLILPLAALVLFMTEPVLHTWLGRADVTVVWTVRGIGLAMLLGGLTSVPWYVIQGMGFPVFTTIASAAQNIVLALTAWTLFFTSPLGYYSVLVGYIAGYAAAAVITFTTAERVLSNGKAGPSSASFAWEVVRCLLVQSVIAVGFTALRLPAEVNRLYGLAMILFFLALSWLGLWLFGLGRTERSYSLRLARSLLGASDST